LVTLLKVMCFCLVGITFLSMLTPLTGKLFGKSSKLARALRLLLVGGILVGGGYWLVARAIAARRISQNEKRAADQREKLDRQEAKDAIETVITTSNAVRDWKNNLCAQVYASPILSSEIQSVLVRPDNRPVLITGFLRDMRDQTGRYVLSFSVELCREARLQVELDASSDEASVVLARRSESPPYYAVAARVVSVEKTETVAPNGDSVFLVHGECSKLVFTGFEGFSIDMDESLARPHP
jgi:hypothetical protein